MRADLQIHLSFCRSERMVLPKTQNTHTHTHMSHESHVMNIIMYIHVHVCQSCECHMTMHMTHRTPGVHNVHDVGPKGVHVNVFIQIQFGLH